MTSREIADKILPCVTIRIDHQMGNWRNGVKFTEEDKVLAIIDAALASRDKVIALAVELARKVAATYPGGSCAGSARELLAAAEAVKVKP